MTSTLALLLLTHASLGQAKPSIPANGPVAKAAQPAVAHTASPAQRGSTASPKSTSVHAAAPVGHASNTSRPPRAPHAHETPRYPGPQEGVVGVVSGSGDATRADPPVDADGALVITDDGAPVVDTDGAAAVDEGAAVVDPDASAAGSEMRIDDGQGETPTIYRWTDSEGGVHYSDADLVPESARAGAVPTAGEPILVTRPPARPTAK